jgi:hypothetical protein
MRVMDVSGKEVSLSGMRLTIFYGSKFALMPDTDDHHNHCRDTAQVPYISFEWDAFLRLADELVTCFSV